MATQVSIQGNERMTERPASIAAARAHAAIAGMRRVLIWFCDRIEHARSGASKPKQVHLVESLGLGNHRQLLLVVCGSQKYLVGVGADSVSSILPIGSAASSDQSALPTARSRARTVKRTGKGLTLVRKTGQQHSMPGIEIGPAVC